jgi:hypothetical protein
LIAPRHGFSPRSPGYNAEPGAEIPLWRAL